MTDCRRRRRSRRVRPGDGSPLRAWRPWHALSRSVLATHHAGHLWTVDVDFFDWEDRVLLHRDGRCWAESTMPAAFPVPGAHIEVASSLWGLSRAHVVHEDGREELIRPLSGTAEAWRARMGRRFPRTSRILAVLAVVVLALNLALLAMSTAEWVTHRQWVQPWTDPWTSPVEIPAGVATALVVAGVLAAVERALTVRSHWLLDAETGWLDLG